MPVSLTLGQVRSWLKKRPVNAHKGTSGRVLIIAGSRGMVGAGVLSAMGAIRSGAGLVKLATVKSQQVVAAKRAPLEVTTFGLAEDRSGRLSRSAWPQIKELLKEWRPDVVAVGPGLGVSEAVLKIVRNLLSIPALRVVVDADGLRALNGGVKQRNRAQMVITPHEGEMARLFGVRPSEVRAQRQFYAKKAAEQWSCVCLLKGPESIVSDGKKLWRNSTGNPAMAVGGMGDALTGIIAALWASKDSQAWQAVSLGAFLHGMAGDLALRDFPERTMLATDLIAHLPETFRRVWRKL